jgi:hypothetical protein
MNDTILQIDTFLPYMRANPLAASGDLLEPAA